MAYDLLQQGLWLMLYGIATVFVFLMVLLAAMAALAAAVRRLQGAPAAAPLERIIRRALQRHRLS